MRKAILALIGAATIAGLASPAAAQTAGDRADARCILMLNVAGRDPKNTKSAGEGLFYYLGRVSARGMTGKLETLLFQESKVITNAAQAQSELNRCGKELNSRGSELRTAFQNLQAKAAASAKPGAK